jgi:hypothetical protein
MVETKKAHKKTSRGRISTCSVVSIDTEDDDSVDDDQNETKHEENKNDHIEEDDIMDNLNCGRTMTKKMTIIRFPRIHWRC